MASATGRRVGSYLLGALACALLFLIPSAYVAGRGAPAWLAAIVGALAFPVLPGAWHVLAERRRKRAAMAAGAAKPTAKPAAALTGRDRFVLRMIAVAVVAIAPLVALDASGVWRGVRHHATWFVPAGDVATATTAELLARVPPDAEAVVVVRGGQRLVAARSDLETVTAVFALGDGKALLVTAERPISPRVASLVGQWLGRTWDRPVDPLIVTTAGRHGVAVSPAWNGVAGGPAPALLAELARAPADAVLVAGVVPITSRDRLSIRAAAGWMTRTETQVALDGRVEALDPEQAARFVAQARAALPMLVLLAPAACRDTATAIVDGITFEQLGAIVTVRAVMTRDQAVALASCVAPRP